VKKGDRVRFVGGAGHPLRGPARGAGAVALAFGGVLAGEHPLVDWVEETEDGAAARSFKWIFQADSLVVLPGVTPLAVDDAARLFNDPAWCAANPAHPLAIMRRFFDQLEVMHARGKTWQPCIKVSKGDAFVLLGPEMPDEERRECLERLAES